MDRQDVLARLRNDLIFAPDPMRTQSALEEATSIARSWTEPLPLAQVFQILSTYHVNQAHFGEAEMLISEGERRVGNHLAARLTLAHAKGTVLYRQGRYTEAAAVLERARDILPEGELRNIAARIWTSLAGVYDSLGETEKADDTYRFAIELRELEGDANGLAVVYYNYAELLTRREDVDLALQYYVRAYELESKAGSRNSLAQTASQISLLYAQLGDAEESLAYLDEAVSAARSSAVPMTIAYCLANAANVYERLGDEVSRKSALVEAVRYCEDFPFPSISMPAVGNLGAAYLNDGDYAAAEPLLRRALAMSQEHGYRYAEGHWLLALGTLANRTGNYSDAITLLQRAVEILTETRSTEHVLETILELANAHAGAGSLSEAYSRISEWARKTLEEHKSDLKRRLTDAQRRLEQERRRKDSEIDRLKNIELSEANTLLQQANEELADLADEKDEFLAVAAHDLRNPLGDIRATLQTIVSSQDVLTKEEIIELCADLVDSVGRMQNTIHSFLEINRSERRQHASMERETVDLTILAHRVAERQKLRAENKDITLSIDSEQPLWAQGDASIIDAILDNLVTNAIKYSPRATTVLIRTEVRDGHPTICVMDEGPGIPESERSSLFKKYARLSPRPTAGEDSLGLGLYLASRMANRIGGRISYCDAERGGACFRLHLVQT